MNHPDYHAYLHYWGRPMTASGIYSSKIHAFSLWAVTLYACILLTYTIYLLRTEFAKAVEMVQILCMTATSLGINVVLYFATAKYENVWRLLGSQIFNYNREKYAQSVANHMREANSAWGVYIGTRFSQLCASLSFFLCCVRVPVTYFFLDSDEDALRSLPFTYWFPGDPLHNWTSFIFCALVEYIVIFFVTVTYAAFVSSFMVIANDICTEFEILKFLMRNIIERTDKRYAAVNGNNKKFNRHLYILLLRDSLDTSLKHHKQVIILVKNIKEACRVPLFFIVMEATFRLCFGGVVLTMPGVAVPIKLSTQLLAGATLMHMAIFCYFSQQFYDSNINIGDELYFSQWTDCSQEIKSALLILLPRTKRSLALTTGFKDLKLESFAAVVQSAFSFYNLLMAFHE